MYGKKFRRMGMLTWVALAIYLRAWLGAVCLRGRYCRDLVAVFVALLIASFAKFVLAAVLLRGRDWNLYVMFIYCVGWDWWV